MGDCVNFHKTRSLNWGNVLTALTDGERPIPNVGATFRCTPEKKGTTEGRLIGFPLTTRKIHPAADAANPLLTAESAFPAFVSDGEPVALLDPLFL